MTRLPETLIPAEIKLLQRSHGPGIGQFVGLRPSRRALFLFEIVEGLGTIAGRGGG
jgi:hypothetical protein